MLRTLLFLLCLAAAQDASAAVRVDTGSLDGVTDGRVTAFLGIPYAASPLGDLRWRPPEPATPWTGTRPARRFAPACPQTAASMPGETLPTTSEDCLYLNVWAPTGARRAPVIVWIHGGGFTSGATSLALYDGAALARRGVVMVTVAYRLGPLGFLAHPDLSQESADRASGNYGLMDQVAALAWVRRNIAAFGGDPGNVTLAGQSAGASSVAILMAAPAARGLFHRAIGQSGGFFEPVDLRPDYRLPGAEQAGKRYAQSRGATTVGELRNLPLARLLGPGSGAVSHPVVAPGAILPRAPYDAFVAGEQARVPLLVGGNSEEARAFSVPPTSAATFARDLTAALGPLPPAIVGAYPFGDDPSARAARLALETDLRFGWNMWAWSELHARRTLSGPRPATFVYRFEARPPFPESSPYAGWGPAHFAELWYMFDHLDQAPWAWTPADRRLSSAMAAAWTNFARRGDPNGPAVPRWPAYTPGGQVMVLGGNSAAGPVLRATQLKVFDRTYGVLREPRPR